jgi:hypothetical protein
MLVKETSRKLPAFCEESLIGAEKASQKLFILKHACPDVLDDIRRPTEGTAASWY